MVKIDKKIEGIGIELLDKFEEKETFGAYNEIIFHGDPFFKLKDWLLMFKSMPRLRSSLFSSILLKVLFNFFSPKSGKNEAGKALKFSPKKKSNTFHRSLYGDLIIFESIFLSQKLFNYSSTFTKRLDSQIRKYLKIVSDEGRWIKYEGENLYKYSLYPQNDHLIPKSHPMNKSFDKWDIAVPDNDSTCLIYSSLGLFKKNGNIPSDAINIHNSKLSLYVDHLKDHLKNEGKFGKGYLSYEGGTLETDSGILTWTMDEHNELDPTININILSYLLVQKQVDAKNPIIDELFNKIISFIKNLCDRDVFLNQRIQLYFPIGVVYFIWYRFLIYSDEFNKELLELDLNLKFQNINSYLIKKMFEDNFFYSDNLTIFDRLMAAPFLIRNGLLSKTEWDGLFKKAFEDNYFKKNLYQFTQLRYPSKIICTVNLIPYAALIYCTMEFNKNV